MFPWIPKRFCFYEPEIYWNLWRCIVVAVVVFLLLLYWTWYDHMKQYERSFCASCQSVIYTAPLFSSTYIQQMHINLVKQNFLSLMKQQQFLCHMLRACWDHTSYSWHQQSMGQKIHWNCVHHSSLYFYLWMILQCILVCSLISTLLQLTLWNTVISIYAACFNFVCWSNIIILKLFWNTLPCTPV